MLLAMPYKVSGAASVNSPVLVELFTSEGCSSCPPADQLLARIQKGDPNAVVLSEHVTYWNGIGWRDPFSSQDSTERQTNYVQRMGLSSNYTPQMVVNGRFEFVGSDAGAAAQALHQAAEAMAVSLTISDLKATHNHVAFSLQTGTVDKDAQLLVVVAQDEGIEPVAGGENGGRTLPHKNVVRELTRLGRWTGAAETFALPKSSDPALRTAILVQNQGGGAILAAAKI
jgi:hypothetical protein